MLPDFIREKILKREREKKDLERPRAYIYEILPPDYVPEKKADREELERGVYEVQILNSYQI